MWLRDKRVCGHITQAQGPTRTWVRILQIPGCETLVLQDQAEALSYLFDVRVRCLRVDASVHGHVSEGVGHVSASAAIVLFNAVHQVLGAEVHQLSRLLCQHALKSPGRAEGPAGSARTLRTPAQERESFFQDLCTCNYTVIGPL